MNFVQFLVFAFFSIFLASCLNNKIDISTGEISAGTIPNPPTAVVVSSVPVGLVTSAVFAITQDTTAVSHEIKILRVSDNVVIKNWTAITSGGSVSGLALSEDVPYYAIIRAVNKAGVSTEVTTEAWLANTLNCVGDMLTNVPYAGGDGSIANPYLICTVDQLLEINNNIPHFGSSFSLLADIDLTGVSFDGIASNANPFKGHFNGNGKIISNMNITRASGDYVGFFNYASFAYVTDMNFADAVISAGTSDYTATVFGMATQSTIRNITLTNASVLGDSKVGIAIGACTECTLHNFNIAGSVKGLGANAGGVVSDTTMSTLMNLTTNANVESVTGYAGGIFASDSGSSTSTSSVQNGNVTGDIKGATFVGGIIGYALNGIKINRSSYSGNIVTSTAGGGIYGAIYPGPCQISSTSTNFTLSGITHLGGAGYLSYVPCTFNDLSIRGTISTTTPGTPDIGGMFGAITTAPTLSRNLIAVAINSTSTTVGGLFGSGTWTGALSAQNNAVVANVAGSNSTNTVSLFAGSTSSTITGTSYYWSGGICDNVGAGDCNTTYGTGVPLLATFFDKTQLPLSTWDFTKVWKENAGTYPELLQTQTVTPSYTHACTHSALDGSMYKCQLAITDADVNETQTILLEPDHTCSWLYSRDGLLTGTPDSSNLGICKISFVVTDGKNKSAVESFDLTVRDDISISPGYWKQYSFPSQAIASGVASTTFTVTNAKTYPLTALSVTGLTEGSFVRNGGTCGSSIPASGSCTITIDFDPSVLGVHDDRMLINYTGSSTPASIEYRMTGTGT
jgi:hypothetical protein